MSFFLLLLIVLFIYGAITLNLLKKRLSSLESVLGSLRKHLSSLQAEIDTLRAQLPAAARPEEPPTPRQEISAELPETDVQPPAAVRVQYASQSVNADSLEAPTSGMSDSGPPRIESFPAQAGPTLAERINSFERLLGTRWLSWAGTVVILVGTAFLLKFMYDRGWIGPAGRVTIGLSIGAVLLVLGEVKLRRLHDLFSQSVSAAGCGALFLTSFLSFKFYDFSGRTATFALLCWFAFFAVSLAVVRRGRILAYLGLLAAYLTPYLLSTGQDQAEELFAFLAILAVAAAFVNAARNWRGIASLCLACSWIYYGGWFFRFYSPERLSIAVAGAGGMMLLIGLISLSRGLWHKSAVRMEECVVLAAAAVLGLSYLWHILHDKHEQVLGFILCALALLALAALKAAVSRRAATPTLEAALLGLASGSLLLVIPACLRADGAMLSWALGAVLFADMGIRSRRLLLECAAGICLLAGLWAGAFYAVGHTGIFIPIANRIFLAWLSVILAWFITGLRYFRTCPQRSDRHKLGMLLLVASSFMLIALLTYEAIAWFDGMIGSPGVDVPLLEDYRNIVLCVLWAACPWLWLLRARPKPYLLSALQYAVLGLAFLGLLAHFHHRETMVFLNPVFWAAVLVPAGIFLVGGRIEEGGRKMRDGLQVYAHLLWVILIAVEIQQGLYLSTWSASSRGWVRLALISVAWAVYATVLLGIGIARNIPAWRWFALSLLGITLIKVLFLDMAEVRQIWRVLSFMALGALLMICSYAYSRHERLKRTAGNASAPDKG